MTVNARRRSRAGYALLPLLLVTFVPAAVQAWGPKGHRLVALVATNHLSAAARQNIDWLLDGASLADVAVWADQYVERNKQTSSWHYVNIPSVATAYDRDRDCPRPRGASSGRNERWRDCVVDRIEYHQERLANRALDRADRAESLKFLVHLVGDAHQPFHAVGVARGGNDIPVSVFGSSNCAYDGGAPYPCNLHGVWDSTLIARRRLSDRRYLDALEALVVQRGLEKRASGSAAEWVIESHALANAALVARDGAVDDAYYRAQIPGIDERLAIGGLRLAATLNRSLAAAPPSR